MNKVAEVQDPWTNSPWYKKAFHYIFSDSNKASQIKSDAYFPEAKTKFKNAKGDDLNAGIHSRERCRNTGTYQLKNNVQKRLVPPIITKKIIEDITKDLIAHTNRNNTLIP